MEEILESIKKVIARDNRLGATMEHPLREEAVMNASATNPVTHDEPVDDVLDLADGENLEETGAAGEAPLVTEEARVSMRDSLAALAMLAQPGAPPQIVRSGETSLEGLTRELLRPALADWLDKHLPAMVERMVAAEISRIIGKRG